MNLFEEISFFKENEEFLLLPIYLTLLNIPSVLFEIFPFIFLISTLFFFIEIIDKEEINILKLYGITNLKIIQILSLLTFFIGFLILIFFYNISSNLKFFYFDLKNQYTKDDKYLAVVTGNGLWIRDEVGEFINYINAEKLENDNLYGVTISQFNKNFEIEKVIISEKAKIKTKNWVLMKVIVNSQNNSLSFDELEFFSNFDEKRMLSIFDNLSSLDLLKLEALKKDYEMLGYNTETLNGYKHRLYSYPLYLAIMVCIGSILMLNIKHNKSKILSITLGIIISVIIYYINYFFNVIIETKDVPYLTSIWGPQIILSLIIITNLIRINEK
jgi:lipopolysaccharide export system permease protein